MPHNRIVSDRALRVTRAAGRSLLASGLVASLFWLLGTASWLVVVGVGASTVGAGLVIAGAKRESSFGRGLRDLGFERQGRNDYAGSVEGIAMFVRIRDGMLGLREILIDVPIGRAVDASSEGLRVAFGSWLRTRLLDERGIAIRVGPSSVAIVISGHDHRGPSAVFSTIRPVLEGVRAANASSDKLLESMVLTASLATPDRLTALARMTPKALPAVASLLDETPVLATATAKRLGFHPATEAAMLRVAVDADAADTDRIDAVGLLGTWGSTAILGLQLEGASLPLTVALDRAAKRVRNEHRGRHGQLSIADTAGQGGLAIADEGGSLSLDDER